MSEPYPPGSTEPSWTGQATEPPRRSRGRFVLGALVTVALVLLTLALTRWLGLGPTLLDTGEVERDVARQFEEQYDQSAEVDCPRRMEVVEGQDYECDARTADGDEFVLVVTVTDEDDAAYSWDVD